MTQNTLFGKEELLVEIKKSFGGFVVCHPDSTYYPNSKEGSVREWSKEKVDSYEWVGTAECEFAKQVISDYCANGVDWKETKFQDSRGYFWLDGVKVNWELRTEYIGLYHIEFKTEDSEPCLLTETGYRSDFPSNLDFFDTMDGYIKEYIEYELKEKKYKKEYVLEFDTPKFVPIKQRTLIEMKGGED